MGNEVEKTVDFVKTLILLHKLYSEYRHTAEHTEYDTELQSDVKEEQEGKDHILKLDAALKDQFDRVFNADFSNVKIHTGKYAGSLARSVSADAVTIGNDIYFSDGKFAPDTEEGVRLLAHELQHVVQFQADSRMVYLEDFEQLEREAGRVEELMEGKQLHNLESSLLDQSGLPDTDSVSQAKDGGVPLQKSGKTAENLDDFTVRRDKPLIEITLGNGEKVQVQLAQYDAIKESVKNYWAGVLESRRNLLTDEDFAQFVLKFGNYVNSRI